MVKRKALGADPHRQANPVTVFILLLQHFSQAVACMLVRNNLRLVAQPVSGGANPVIHFIILCTPKVFIVAADLFKNSPAVSPVEEAFYIKLLLFSSVRGNTAAEHGGFRH